MVGTLLDRTQAHSSHLATPLVLRAGRSLAGSARSLAAWATLRPPLREPPSVNTQPARSTRSSLRAASPANPAGAPPPICTYTCLPLMSRSCGTAAHMPAARNCRRSTNGDVGWWQRRCAAIASGSGHPLIRNRCMESMRPSTPRPGRGRTRGSHRRCELVVRETHPRPRARAWADSSRQNVARHVRELMISSSSAPDRDRGSLRAPARAARWCPRRCWSTSARRPSCRPAADGTPHP